MRNKSFFISFRAQKPFNLTLNKNKTLDFFASITIFKNDQTELIRNLKAYLILILKCHKYSFLKNISHPPFF